MGDFVLHGGRLVLADRILHDGAIVVRRGSIEAILGSGEPLPALLPRIDAAGAWVTPGLVEIHIHGCGGVGFDSLGTKSIKTGGLGDCDTVESDGTVRSDNSATAGAASLLRARDFLRGRGVTCFVPTLVCREPEVAALAAALDAAALPDTVIPGIYVEGPFINIARRGGIPADTVRDPDLAELRRLLNLARGRIRLMTIAPECPGAAKVMARLEAAGVLVCLGHSDCSIERDPLPAGNFSITHLFNAMSPFSHREPGLAMLPFVDRRPYVELNADGVHVGDSALRAAAKAIDPERLILISDAVVAAGLPHGVYSYYGMKIISGPNGVRYADSGTLMGSNRLAPDVLRNWLRVTGAAVPDAVRALSLTPARALGQGDRRGAIAVGLVGEFVVWDGEFESVRMICD